MTSPTTNPTANSPNLESSERIRANVRAGYASVANAAVPDASCCGAGGCCAPGSAGVATRIGYDQADLDALPDGAEMGLGCGNPTALASLAPGETVLDLGSGGGVDVFLAALRVGADGASGRAIGVDMTPDMLSKARAAIPAFRERSGLDNAEFRLGEIENLPVADASVDVVISNCVINLSPDKPRVWREMARVLRPGGRVAVSDIVLLRPLPDAVATMIESWVGCVAGACTIDDLRAMATDAGLTAIDVEPKPDYVAALEDVQDPLYRRIADALPDGATLADYVVSANITATKPGA